MPKGCNVKLESVPQVLLWLGARNVFSCTVIVSMFFFWKDKTLFLFAFRLVLQWLPLKLLEVVCLLFTNKFLPGLGTLLPRTYLYTDYAVFLQIYGVNNSQVLALSDVS